MGEMEGAANHSINQMTVAGEGIIRCGEEKFILLDVETGQEQNKKVLKFVTTEEVIKKQVWSLQKNSCFCNP